MGNKILWIPFIYLILFAVLLAAAKIYQEFRKALFDLTWDKGVARRDQSIELLDIYEFKD